MGEPAEIHNVNSFAGKIELDGSLDSQEYHFDAIAEQYDRSVPGIPTEFMDLITEVGQIGERSTVVELGCGSGELAVMLSAKVDTVVAVDSSTSMLQIARRRDKKRSIRWIEGKAESITLPTDSVDMFLAFESFHLFEDKDAVISNAKSSLRAGGILCIGSCNYHWETVFQEVMIEVFENHSIQWQDWDYQTCPDFPKLIHERFSGFGECQRASCRVYDSTTVTRVVDFLTSIEKTSSMTEEARCRLRDDLMIRFKEIVSGEYVSGYSDYYLTHTKLSGDHNQHAK